MNQLIQRLERWLRDNAPNYYASLDPGVSSEAISSFEDTHQVRLPDLVRDLWQWRQPTPHGKRIKVPQLCWPYGGQQTPFRFCSRIMNDFIEVAAAESELPYFWRPSWVPLIGEQDNFLVLDPEGVVTGNQGQLIYVENYSETHGVMARNFEEYLRPIVESMEHGLWEVDDIDNEIRPKNWDEFDEFYAERSDSSYTFFNFSGEPG